MAYPVWSSTFIEYTDGSPNTSFEVPAQYVAVVRQISLCTELGATQLQVFVQNTAGAPAVTIAYLGTAGVLTDDQREGRWVAPPGGIIEISQLTLGVGASAWVGGYLLPQ